MSRDDRSVSWPVKSRHSEDVDVSIFWIHVFVIGVCAHCEVRPDVVEKRANELYWNDLVGEVETLEKKGVSIPLLREIVDSEHQRGKWCIILKNSAHPEKQWPVPCEKNPERIHYLLEAVI